MSQNCSIYTQSPADFDPKVEVAGCFCTFENKILLMKRHPSRPQGETWGVPAGKIEFGEDPKTAVIREVLEETGLVIKGDLIEAIATYYARLPHIDYIYHSFHVHFDELPKLSLELEEHTEARWVTIEEAKNLPLIGGGIGLLKFYQEFLQKKMRN